MIRENIKLDLKENQEYSLKVRVKVQSQTATSQKYIFSKLYSSFTLYSQLKPCITDHEYMHNQHHNHMKTTYFLAIGYCD